jgi:hypothetical protein
MFIPVIYLYLWLILLLSTISIELMVCIQLTYNRLLLGYPVVIKVVVLYTLLLLVLHSKNSAIAKCQEQVAESGGACRCA